LNGPGVTRKTFQRDNVLVHTQKRKKKEMKKKNKVRKKYSKERKKD